MLKRLILASLILAAPVGASAGRVFTIGGQAFAEDEILDARGLPSIDGTPVVMITFSEVAAKRFSIIAASRSAMELPVVVDGKPLSTLVVDLAMTGGAIEVAGVQNLPEAIQLARLISGKEPLPDELEP